MRTYGYSHNRSILKGLMAGTAIIIVTALLVLGSAYLSHASYMHHNPNATTADWLYGEQR